MSAGETVRGDLTTLSLLSALTIFMATVDMNIVIVGLPQIRPDLGATPGESSWFVTSYLVANLCTLAISGWLRRRYGSRTTLSTAIALFGASSLLASASPNATSLIVLRAMQGLAGGVMWPTASAMLVERFPISRRSTAIAITSAGAVGGPLLGPILGGWLVNIASWRAIFYLNVPLCVLLWVIARATLGRQTAPREAVQLSRSEFFFLASWLVSLQVVLEEGPAPRWFHTPWIAGVAVVGVASFVSWVLMALAAKHPLLDLRIALRRRLRVPIALTAINGVVIFAGLFAFTIWVQESTNRTPLQTGYLLMAAAGAQGASLLFLPRLLRTFPQLPWIPIGFVALAISCWAYTGVTGQESAWQLVWPQMLRAVASIIASVALRTWVFAGTPKAEVADTTSILRTSQELAGSVAVSLSALALLRGSRMWISMQGLAPFDVEPAAHLALYEQRLTSNASYSNLMFALFAISLLAAFISLGLRRNRCD